MVAEQNPKQILFVCDLNASRSQIAETILRHEMPNNISVCSAGIDAAQFVNPFTARLMLDFYQEDLLNKEPQSITEIENVDQFDLFIALSENAFDFLRDKKKNNELVGNIEYWDIGSPPDENQRRELIMDGYRFLHDDIKQHIKNRFME
jgi:protein-tyrosine-phosphatase